MMAVRRVLCILTIALCCVCSVKVAAQADGQLDGAALQTTSSDENHDEMTKHLEDTVEETQYGSGKEAKKPCERLPSAGRSPPEAEKVQEEETESRTGLPSNTKQAVGASAAGAPRPAATPPADVKACPPGENDPPCTPGGAGSDAANAECVKPPSGAESCPTNVDETQENCASGGSGCKNQTQENHAKSNENHGNNGNEHRGPDGESRLESDRGSVSDLQRGDRAEAPAVVTPGEKETPETPSRNGSQDAGASPAVGSSDATAADGQTERNGTSATEEGGSKQGSETAQPSPSSNNSATGSDVGSDAASPENGTSSAESESSNKQQGAGNADTETTTTTTTTTLPPELTNNKKGDADSSSSISSSVWMRVPLLIVVTLACILVC
ncbi:uncharacterized protein TM35_000901040 [Trypanosoma theileri]|uniref:Mucin-associated surface protein (MASP) n=1 Tax=Trypanosoma theileri TaxID=67003 RepID=A0A1X0NET2_9TRYP|nr:uncharacterized protein TM35_000901040 [Trypanosoma theileri]ORC82506.1 hypothetical protein TM35_000901040 [Trypanosoma theileri]